jgi:hypothetical protein
MSDNGNQIGDIIAAGFCDAATPPVITAGFGVVSAARSAKGIFTVTLFNQIDPRCCAIDADAVAVDTDVAVNVGAADTADVKNFRVTTAGADADVGFFFKVTRTKFVPG